MEYRNRSNAYLKKQWPGQRDWEDNCLPCLSSFLSVFQKELRHPNGWKTQTKRKEIGEKVK